jgi:hypothetical protein
VALLGSHSIYHIDETKYIPIHTFPDKPVPASNGTNPSVPGILPEEQRYIDTFKRIDLTKNFYFSYTYDVTNTFQKNVELATQSAERKLHRSFQKMFVWNVALIKPFVNKVNEQWILPIVHGFVDQAKISVFGRPLFIILIARRSNRFAGTRYLRRGVSSEGYVANEVETEQILCDAGNNLLNV